jgi:hypothetical protein
MLRWLSHFFLSQSSSQFSDSVASLLQSQTLPEFSSSYSFFSFSQHFWTMSLAAPEA